MRRTIVALSVALLGTGVFLELGSLAALTGGSGAAVIASGAGRAAGGGVIATQTVGQTAIGVTGNSEVRIGSGIWFQVPSNAQVAVTEAMPTPPRAYRLDQNVPNPFNPTTEIGFALPAPGRVRLAVYDVAGRQIASLIDRELPAGEHTVEFHAGGLSSGTYFYRLEANGFSETRVLTLIK